VKDYSIETLIAKGGKGWSIFEILEHIHVTDKAIYHLLSTPSEKKSDSKEIVGAKKLEFYLVQGRNKRKVQSPNLLQPKGRFQDLAEFTTAFTSARNNIKSDLLSGKIIVDNRIHNHFIIGEMTITDWLYFVLYHAERHLKQIEDKYNEVSGN